MRPGYPGPMYGQEEWERLSLLCLVTCFEGYYPRIKVYAERPHGMEWIAKFTLGSVALIEGKEPAVGQWYRAFSKPGLSWVDRSIPFVFVQHPAGAVRSLPELQVEQLERRRKDRCCWHNCFLLEQGPVLSFECPRSRNYDEWKLRFLIDMGGRYAPDDWLLTEVVGPPQDTALEIYSFFDLFIADFSDPLLLQGSFDMARVRLPTSKKALEERKRKTKFPKWLLLPPEAYWWQTQEPAKRSRVITPMEL